MAPAAPPGERITPRPARPIASSLRTGPSPSTEISVGRRALTNAKAKSPTPSAITASKLARAEVGMLAVAMT
jgi:hypothetical protein